MYGFERNRQRWPDGNFHLIDRGYLPWRGHQIALSGEQLKGLGYDDWGRFRFNGTTSKTFASHPFAVLESDSFPAQAKWHLRHYVDLLFRIAEAVSK